MTDFPGTVLADAFDGGMIAGLMDCNGSRSARPANHALFEATLLQWKRIPFLLGALLLGGLVANWSWQLIRLDHLRHNGRTALATIDQTIEQSQHGSARSTRWVRYHFIPRDSETAVQGYDRIDWSMDESRQGALMTKPLQIKYLPEDPGFSRVAETVIDRVVSTRVAIVLTGTVAVLVAGCGLLVGTSRRTALATWWSSRTAGP